ncbi:type II toxin-antitoxin system RelE/ParE family toxin [Sutterella sp.]|uniref:type II toxin-antitoxin system RelE/ParE family toxin n=1 Tax=Sutterella sp. TaxID=1981025 RepID=UPI003FD8663E
MAIRSFVHSGLERFALTGDTSGIKPSHASRLNQVLAMLSLSGGSVLDLKQINGFHCIKRKTRSLDYAVRVSGSWRVTFKIDASGDIFDVDYVQYH